MKCEVINKHTCRSECYNALKMATKSLGITDRNEYFKIHNKLYSVGKYENNDVIIQPLDITITDYFDDEELKQMKAIVNGEIPIGNFKMNPDTTNKIMTKRMKEEENEPNTEETDTQFYNLFDEE